MSDKPITTPRRQRINRGMTKKEAIRLLKTEKQIDCLDQQSYFMFLALRVEISVKNLETSLAKLVKAYAQ